MKKIVIILIFVVSNLFSQGNDYWQKIDFEFDSGIKQINIYQIGDGYYHYSSDPFLILTNENKLYYFDDVDSSGRVVVLPDVLEIKEVSLGYYQEFLNIFILADAKLYFTQDLGNTWSTFTYNEEEISNIIDFEILDVSYTNINILTENNSFYHCDYSDNWNLATEGLEGVKLKYLLGEMHDLSALSEGNKLFYYNNSKWYYEKDLNIDYQILNEHKIRYHNNYYFIDEDFNFIRNNLLVDSSRKVTCFTISIFYDLIFLMEYLPEGFEMLYGTNKEGIFFSKYDQSGIEIEKLDNVFDDYKITDMETNALANPTFCLVGTEEGDLFYGNWKIKTDVRNNSSGGKYNLSPNPATEYIEIRNLTPSLSQGEGFSLNIFDVLGKSVAKKTLNKSTPLFSKESGSSTIGGWGCVINVSHLQPGIYFVRVDGEFLKFVKM